MYANMYADRNETVIEFSNESIRVRESIEEILGLISNKPCVTCNSVL